MEANVQLSEPQQTELAAALSSSQLTFVKFQKHWIRGVNNQVKPDKNNWTLW